MQAAYGYGQGMVPAGAMMAPMPGQHRMPPPGQRAWEDCAPHCPQWAAPSQICAYAAVYRRLEPTRRRPPGPRRPCVQAWCTPQAAAAAACLMASWQCLMATCPCGLARWGGADPRAIS